MSARHPVRSVFMGYIEELRKLVGHRPVILVGVAIAVLNERGEILLQKRWDGSWGLPGGLMEPGESTEETGRREVFEETGLMIGEMKLLDIFSGEKYFVKLPNGDQFYPVTIVYLSDDIAGGTLKPDGIESTEVHFFKQDKLPEKLHFVFKDLMDKYGCLAPERK